MMQISARAARSRDFCLELLHEAWAYLEKDTGVKINRSIYLPSSQSEENWSRATCSNLQFISEKCEKYSTGKPFKNNFNF